MHNVVDHSMFGKLAEALEDDWGAHARPEQISPPAIGLCGSFWRAVGGAKRGPGLSGCEAKPRAPRPPASRWWAADRQRRSRCDDRGRERHSRHQP